MKWAETTNSTTTTISTPMFHFLSDKNLTFPPSEHTVLLTHREHTHVVSTASGEITLPRPLCQRPQSVVAHGRPSLQALGLTPLATRFGCERPSIPFPQSHRGSGRPWECTHPPRAGGTLTGGRKDCKNRKISWIRPGARRMCTFSPVSYTHLTLPTNREVEMRLAVAT